MLASEPHPRQARLMDTQRYQMLPLPQSVQYQIQSSIAITSLSDVVIELIKNSLDAQSRAVYVDIDYRRGGCRVEDDGNGIPSNELSVGGLLGSMYCTSKHKASTEMYGNHGRFISSLSALSLLSITSRHRAEADEYTVSFHEAQAIARFRTTQEHQRVLHNLHGTRVTVRDLFRKMPVRVKRRAIQYEFQENLDKEFEDLKRKIVSLLLAWSKPVKVVLSDPKKRRRCLLRLNHESLPHGERDTEIDTKVPFRLDWICALLFQAGYIAQPSLASWVTASARTSSISIYAAISLEPAPTKQVQFISIGLRPVDPVHGSQVLFDEINHIFASSNFGAIENHLEISGDEKSRHQSNKRYNNNDHTSRRLRGIAKVADRWPMFYIKIDPSSECRLQDDDDDQILDSGDKVARFLHVVSQLLKTLIYRFLEEHHFRPQVRRQKRAEGINEVVGMADFSSDPTTHPGPHEGNLWSSDTIKSIVGTTAKPSSLVLRRCVTGPGFGNWSRMKSGRQDGRKHIISGLPQSKGLQCGARPATAPAVSTHSHNSESDTGQIELGDEQSQSALHNDLQLLFRELQNEDLISSSTEEARADDVCRSVISASDPPRADEEYVVRHDTLPADKAILWSDPTTGRVLHINSRTGHIVPDFQDHHDDIEAIEKEYSTNRFGEAVSFCKKNSSSSFWPTRPRMKSDLHITPESWIGRLLRDSENSVFRHLEAAIPSVAPEEAPRHGEGPCCSHSMSDTGSLKHSSALFNFTTAVIRLSKGGLDGAQVLAQVDRKFILAKVTTSQTHAQISSPVAQEPLEETVLVLIDQHAADERCQVEALYAELGNVESVQLVNPVCFEVSTHEIRLFEVQKNHLGSWGFSYEIQPEPTGDAFTITSSWPHKRPNSVYPRHVPTISVTALPQLIAERCRLEPKILISLLRKEIWARAESGIANNSYQVSEEESKCRPSDLEHCDEDKNRWPSKISTCPRGLIAMLNSRACRSAIMFNDVLSIDECKALVKRLAKCSLPFQCAHGRPSMVVLGGFGLVNTGDGKSLPADAVQEGGHFARAFDSWQANIGQVMDGE